MTKLAMKDLKSKVIIVAGGTGGIGCATVRLLSSQGAIVVVASRKQPPATMFNNVSVSAFQGDLGHSQNWDELVEYVQLKHKHVDALINCVGVLGPDSLETMSECDVETTMRANFLSVVYGAQAVLPVMRQQNHGVIVTVGSIGGIVPMPFASLYSATKYAVRGFSLSLSQELIGTGIHSSLISLGPVHTRMLEAEAAHDRRIIAFINSPLQPEFVAQSISSLLLNPKREMVLPRGTGALSILCNLVPGLFALCYRVLQQVGASRLRSYRNEFCTSIPFTNPEAHHVRTS